VYGAGFSNFHEGTSLINKIEPADQGILIFCWFTAPWIWISKTAGIIPCQAANLHFWAWIILLWGIFIILCGVLERVKTYTTPEARNLWDLMRRGARCLYWQNRLCVKREKKLQVKFEKTCKRQYKSFEIKSDCFESDDQIIDEIFRKAVKDETGTTLYI